MTFNIKKLMITLAIMTLGASVVACSNSDKEENINNTAQQNEQIDNTVAEEETMNEKEEISEEEPQITEDELNEEEQQINEEESQITDVISEEKALEICKEKVNEVWNIKFLELGTNEGGLDKIISFNGKEYYGIYYVNDTVSDFRFLVDKSTGEVFYDTVPALQNLIPIDQYIAEAKN